MNDQFSKYGRIPLRPLSYKNRHLATTSELIIDYGSEGTENWHIYITDDKKADKLIDLTELIAEKVIPGVDINADQFYITLEGEDGLFNLKDIMNHIYKRYIYPNKYGHFDPSDAQLLFEKDVVNCMFRDSDGHVIVPITAADNVFFQNGTTLADVFDKANKLSMVSYTVNVPRNTDYVDFDYPYENYHESVTVMYNGYFLHSDEYATEVNIINSDLDYYTGRFHLIERSLNAGDKLEFIFVYNSKLAANDNFKSFDGKSLSVKSIPTNRLHKVSDSINKNDSDCLATSAAVYSMCNTLTTFMADNAENSCWCADISEYNTYIHIENNDKDIKNYDCFQVNVFVANAKPIDVLALIKYRDDSIVNIPIVDADGNPLTNGIPAGKTLRLVWVKSEQRLRLLTSEIKQNRYIYRCSEGDTTIPFSDLSYYTGTIINVYRNGVRLFEDLDYSADYKNQTINLYSKTQQGEIIVFENIYV